MLAAIRANDFQRLFAEDGIDTFVFRGGLIQVQTVRYTLQHKGPEGPGWPASRL